MLQDSEAKLLEENDIINALRNSGSPQRRALEAIYDANYGPIEHHVISNNGSRDDARDVFQEGLIILCRNIRLNKFQGTSSLGTYLFSICRFVWLKMLQRKARFSDADIPEETDYHDPNYVLVNDEGREQVQGLLAELGETCREILKLYYFEQMSMTEVAEIAGYKDEQNARNKKYKCMKTLQQMLADRPELQRELKNWLGMVTN